MPIDADLNKLKRTDFTKVVLVLGMHRSGTSSLMGSLEELGLNIGQANNTSQYNSKGNKEIPDFRKWHDQIFANNQANWNQPKNIIDWSETNLKELYQLIKNHFGDLKIWGLKDPRLLFMIKAWFQIIPKKKIVFFASVRHPISVVKSLLKRGNINSEKEGFLIWKKYNKRLLFLSKKFNIQFIDFDNDAAQNNRIIMSLFSDMIGPPAKQNLSFYDERLVHSKETIESCPESLRSLYDQLLINCKNTAEMVLKN